MAQAASQVRVRITGRVQGVSFRAWVRAEADRRGLRGWVRNEADGAVAALLAGPPVAVQEMVGELRKGPPLAEVEEVDVTEAAGEPVPDGFEIRR